MFDSWSNFKASWRIQCVSAKILATQAARVEKVSFPGKSLREAILNGICHADYEFPSNIKVEFFSTFCRISNPGPIYRYSLPKLQNNHDLRFHLKHLSWLYILLLFLVYLYKWLLEYLLFDLFGFHQLH